MSIVIEGTLQIIKCIWTLKDVNDGNKTHISLNNGRLIIENAETSPFKINGIKFISGTKPSNNEGELVKCNKFKYMGAENDNLDNSHFHFSVGKSTFNNSVYFKLFYYLRIIFRLLII